MREFEFTPDAIGVTPLCKSVYAAYERAQSVARDGEQMQNTELLSWEMFGQSTQDLARAVLDDGYRPDFILAIARGGLFTAGALGYALGVKLLHVVNIEFYTGRDERLELPVMLPPIPNPDFFKGLKVLICDDVADTGETLRTTHDFVDQHVAEVRSLVIYEKSRSIIKPEYVWKRTDEWIKFPWDQLATNPDSETA